MILKLLEYTIFSVVEVETTITTEKTNERPLADLTDELELVIRSLPPMKLGSIIGSGAKLS